MTTYLLCFDRSVAVSENYAVYNYLRDGFHISTWWNHIPGVFIFNTERDLVRLQADFLPFFAGKHFLIIEVNPYRTGGWLPQAAWDWLNSGGSSQLPLDGILCPPWP